MIISNEKPDVEDFIKLRNSVGWPIPADAEIEKRLG